MVPLMRFGVLGPLAVWTDLGVPVPIPGLKVRALLADLLVHEGRPVPADRLIDDLWGDTAPGNPGASLSVRVSQLRRVLEDAEPGARALVATRPAGYVLDGGDVDAVRFRELLAESRATADPSARARLLADALALWRGPAFADFADEEFTRPAITALEELHVTALEEQAEARLELGEHAALAGELAAAVAAHPLRERLRAAHMRALYGAGRQNEALEAYERYRTLLADELGLDPGTELAGLQTAILNQDPALDPPAPRSNLPVPSSELIGRDDSVTEIRARLGTARLVTLTGPGGVGKTRLAVETAAGLADAYAGGVWMAELAALDRSTLPDLTETVTAVLDVRDMPGAPAAPLDRLAAALGGRRLLLVLDNCEHVVEDAAALADGLLRRVPGIRILATSREPLGLAGEVVWAVPPLAQESAVRLFAARARAASRGFRMDETTADAVAELCRRLDGLPLALELAATRVRSLGVDKLVERLDDRFRLLGTGHRGAPARQRTLTAMIDWSWDLLGEPERAVLRRLAVHADGCTVEAAEEVCAGGDVDELDVMDLLVRLVDRSLVVMSDRPGEEPRYRLLESVAAYSAERLVQAGERETTRDRHLRYHLHLAEVSEKDLYGPDQPRRLRILDAEAANLRTAIDTAVTARDAQSALGLVNALAWYWFLRGRLNEALRSFEAALALDGGSPAARAKAVTWHTGLGILKGAGPAAMSRRAEALALVDATGDPALRAWARWFLTFAASEHDDAAEGAVVLDEALTAFRASGDRWGEAAALLLRAKHAHAHGDPGALARDAARAADLFTGLGDRWGRLQAGEWLAAGAELTGDYERAGRLQQEGQRMAEELRLWPDVAVRMAWRGWTAMMLGRPAEARTLFGRAHRVGVEQGLAQAVSFAELGLGLTARREGHLDEAEERLGRMLRSVPTDGFPPLFLPLVQVGLGYVAEARGDAAAAVTFQRDALAVAIRLEAPRDLAFSLEGLAGALSLHPDRHREAAAALGKAADIRASARLRPGPAEQDDIDRITARLAGALGEEAFAKAAAEGSSLEPADILRRAEQAPPRGPSVWSAPDQAR